MEQTFHSNIYATKISVRCKLPQALLLFLLAGGCHFAEAQNPSSKSQSGTKPIALSVSKNSWQSRHSRNLTVTFVCVKFVGNFESEQSVMLDKLLMKRQHQKSSDFKNGHWVPLCCTVFTFSGLRQVQLVWICGQGSRTQSITKRQNKKYFVLDRAQRN